MQWKGYQIAVSSSKPKFNKLAQPSFEQKTVAIMIQSIAATEHLSNIFQIKIAKMIKTAGANGPKTFRNTQTTLPTYCLTTSTILVTPFLYFCRRDCISCFHSLSYALLESSFVRIEAAFSTATNASAARPFRFLSGWTAFALRLYAFRISLEEV